MNASRPTTIPPWCSYGLRKALRSGRLPGSASLMTTNSSASSIPMNVCLFPNHLSGGEAEVVCDGDCHLSCRIVRGTPRSDR